MLRTSDRQRNRWRIAIVATLIGLGVFLYRFNALGGSLGGFDDDHFLGLARANQMLAGEWPLRDYPDSSLQGMWPPLAYLPSAAAQLVFGRSLLAEALLVTGAVAVSAALTFVAGVRLGLSSLLAAAAALIAVMPSLRLYGWARPVVFAAFALLIHGYAAQPTVRRLAALSALLACAVLVRHDYGIYIAPGIVAAVAARHWREPAVGAARVAAWGVLGALMLVPSVVSVQLLVGVRPYLDGIRALVDSEQRRTDTYSPGFDWSNPPAEDNLIAWLYVMCFALPVLAAGVAIWRARRGAEPWEAPTVIGVAVTTVIASDLLLRNNLAARFGDVAVLPAMLGVWLLAAAWSRPWRRPVIRAALAVGASGIAIVSLFALAQVGSVVSELRSARFTEGPVSLIRTTIRVGGELRDTPPPQWNEPYPEDGRMLAAAYLHECTSDSDRVLNARYSAEALVLGRRLFAAGRANFSPGHYASDREQQQTVTLAGQQSIPVVLMEPMELAQEFGEEFPIVDAFLREHYEDVGSIRHPDREYARVLARRELRPVRTFGSTGLPCFR